MSINPKGIFNKYLNYNAKKIFNIIYTEIFKPVSIFAFVCIGICLYLFIGFNLTFNIIEKILLFILTIVSCQLFQKMIACSTNNRSITRVTVLLFIVFVFSGAFALVGNPLFLYPLDIPIEAENFIKLLLVCLWMVPICLLILFVIYMIPQKLVKNASQPTPKNKKILAFAICFSIVMCVGILYVIAYNPAISSSDTVAQFMQAKGIYPLENWQTPFHTLSIRVLISILDSPTFVALIQCAYFAFVISSAALFLLELHVKFKMVIIFTALVAVSHNNALHFITLWKDVPYCASLLWLTIIFAKFLIRNKYPVSIFIEFIICSVFVCLLRKNGIVPFVLVAVFVIIIAKQELKTFISILLSILLVSVFNILIVPTLGFSEEPVGGKYIGLGQDIIGVYYAGGELSEEALDIVKVLTRRGNYQYSPYWAYSSYKNGLDISLVEFVKIYMTTYFNNPVVMTRSILCRVDCAWNIKQGLDGFVNCVNRTTAQDDEPDWAINYPARTPNFLTWFFDRVGALTVMEPLRNIFWRCGLLTFLTFAFCIVTSVNKNGKLCLILMPWIGQFLSLLLSTGWMEYRYFWPLWLMSIYSAAITIAYNATNTKNGKVHAI